MKKRLCRLFAGAVVLAAVGIGVPASEAAERLINFDTTAVLSADGSLSVTDSMTFNVENQSIRHGIIRGLPIVAFRGDDGKKREPVITVQQVSLDNVSVGWQLRRMGDWMNVCVGSADKLVTSGTHVYRLQYTARDFVRHFADHDELYWNVTGQEWQFPIDKVTFRMSLPGQPFGQGFSKIAWEVGPVGSRRAMKDAVVVDGSVSTTRVLAPGEGMTVICSFPGEKPAVVASAGRTTGSVLPGLGTLAAMVVVCAWCWYCWGRQPPAAAPGPIFAPPEVESPNQTISGTASPAFLRFVRDLNIGATGLASVLIDLAVKGWITIAEEKDWNGGENLVFVISGTGSEGKKLTGDEEIVLQALGDSMRIDADDVVGRLGPVRDKLAEAIVPFAGKYFDGRGQPRLMKAGLLVLVLGLTGLFFLNGMSGLFTVGAVSLAAVIASFWLVLRWSDGALSLIVRAALAPLLGAAVLFALMRLGYGFSMVSGLCFMAAAALLALTLGLMPHRTEAGRRMLTKSLALALYLGGESGQFANLNPPEPTKEHIEGLLPYAVALEQTRTWGARLGEGYWPLWFGNAAETVNLLTALERFIRAVERSSADIGEG